jgi:hypothetical protein
MEAAARSGRLDETVDRFDRYTDRVQHLPSPARHPQAFAVKIRANPARPTASDRSSARFWTDEEVYNAGFEVFLIDEDGGRVVVSDSNRFQTVCVSDPSA